MTSSPDLSSLRIPREPEERPSGPRGRGPLLLGAALLVVVLAVAHWLFVRSRPLEVQVASAAALGGGSASAAGISANGYVVARTKASVSARVAGQLEYLGVHEGSQVRRGEVIARIQSGDQLAAVAAANAALAQNEAQLAQARRDLERAEALAQKEVLSSADLENARTRVHVQEALVNSARAQLNLAQVELENTRVRAPFDGTVLRKDAEVGEIVAPGAAGGSLARTAIVTMADLATLEVEVDVNEAYIAQVTNGQDARITLDAYSDTSFTGRVRQVVPTADRQKATVLVKVSILDRDPRILPEMGAKVVFTRAAGSGAAAVAPLRVMVPSAALVTGPEGARVWIVENGQVRARRVEPGPERDGQTELRGGLSGGETVVLKPPPGIREGVKVRPVRS